MKYALSLSFGKDSMCMLIEVIKRKLPLDYVFYCDISFDDNTSAEHPVMAEWIPKAEKILKQKFGVEVIHIKPNRTFVEQFYCKKQKGKHIGSNYGFPHIISAWCNARLKLEPIKKFINKIKSKEGICEYVGIAKDEPKRLERYKRIQTEKHKYITLADLGIDELQAMEICKENNLLSPKYEKSFRGGCWFCPKQSMNDLLNLYKNYPKLFNKLKEIEKDSHNTFKPNQTLNEIEKKLKKYEKFVKNS